MVGSPGIGGRGALSGGGLELSNVDIATEFANLIVAQRAFEANARAVTTFDQITQDTINLKQGYKDTGSKADEPWEPPR